MKKIVKILLVCMIVALLIPTVVGAAAPYTTYTYSSTGFVLYSPDAYVPDVVVNSKYMGTTATGEEIAIDTLEDIEVGPDGKIYLSDTVNNRILILDENYKYLNQIDSFTNEQGVPDGFSGISGLFVNEDYIYACDSDNGRIVMFDHDRNFVKTVGQPESALFNTESLYRPCAVAVDSYGRLFIVSSTTYEGIVVMSDNGDFYGYIGAQKVSLSAWEILWRQIRPESAAEDEEKALSSEYNNITVDSKNFLYVTTSSIDPDAQQSALTGGDRSGTYAPVKKLNASGTDVMARNGFYPPSGEVKVGDDEATGGASVITDVAVGPEGTWSIIDEKRSKTFTYDANGNLLFAFGDNGNQVGSIKKISGIAYQGDKLLLLDRDGDNFTVFRRTEYGDVLITALANQNNRNYEAEVDDWYNILKRNNNFDVAYLGIADAMFRDGNYEEAMEMYKAAFDTAGYSNSFKQVRKDWMETWFFVIPVVIIVVLLALSKFLGYASKKNKEVSLKVGQKNVKEELIYAIHVMTHPFDGFWDLKHEKRGSARGAYIILVITILSFFYQAVGTGYIFAGDTTTVDVFMTLTSVAVPLLLWVIANWCLTTLFDGEGTLKDVFVASCYSLTPLPLFIIPSTLLSNVLVSEEATIMTMLETIAFFWVGMLIFFGMMITHGYSIGKGVLTALGTIVGMVFIMFVAVLFSTLLTKVITFVYSIVEEIQYRL